MDTLFANYVLHVIGHLAPDKERLVESMGRTAPAWTSGDALDRAKARIALRRS